jgi:hypothetical protein
MVEILRPHLDRRGKGGGQAKLSVENQLLLVLEYWREYRTQFHIGTSWGLSDMMSGRLPIIKPLVQTTSFCCRKQFSN